LTEPERDGFRALGEHVRGELAALAAGAALSLDDLALLNFRGDLGLVEGGIGCSEPNPDRAAAGPPRSARSSPT
jgi:hypothetical protein